MTNGLRPLGATILARFLFRESGILSSFVIRHLSLALCLLLSSCAGYQVGNWSLYPSDIHTVYVPMFESTSFRRNLGERLTEAVVKEIESTTPYKVVGDSSADSILSGRIIAEGKHAVVQSPYGGPRELDVDMVLQVSWIDRRGGPLRDTSVLALPPELTSVQADSFLVPEFGHSMATAQQQAIQKIAQQIVGLMEAPW